MVQVEATQRVVATGPYRLVRHPMYLGALIMFLVYWLLRKWRPAKIDKTFRVLQLFSAGAVAVTSNSHGGGVAFMAHVAGFLVGVIGVFVFRKRQSNYWG